jgi:hypothetical protein
MDEGRQIRLSLSSSILQEEETQANHMRDGNEGEKFRKA